MNQSTPIERPAAAVSVALNEALWRVFFWMAFGLGTTALVAMLVAGTPAIRDAVIGNNLVFLLCLIAQFAMVIAFGTLAQRLPASGVAALFLAYAALSGVTFAVVFLVYTKASIASTFFITAGTFAAVALFGATTKRDLSAVGSIAFMGLIGFILASVVNLFLRSELLLWITTYAGVAIFVGLTAYDMQKIKQSAGVLTVEGAERERWAVSWALNLYLDFINLFLLLLRIFGNRR
jgi:FtsH-binding integral membrane protein